jgi:hypothetical protein
MSWTKSQLREAAPPSHITGGNAVLKALKGVAILVGAVLGIFGGASLLGFNEYPWSQKSTDRTVILQSIKNVSQLQSAIGTYELVVDTGDDNAAIPDVISGRRTVVLAVGTVDAHVDLSGINEGDLKVSPDGKSATLRLPEAQLEKPRLDHKAFQEYRSDRGVLDIVADVFASPDQSAIYLRAETEIAAVAEKSELRERASENARSTLTGLFNSFGVQVTFLDASAN